MQANRILDTLREKKQNFAADILENRIAECEAAGMLSSGSFDAMGAAEMRGYVNLTQSLWKIYPVETQLAFCCKMICEALRATVDQFKSGETDEDTLCLATVLEMSDLGGVQSPITYSFDGKRPQLGDILQCLCRKALDINEAEEQEMDIDSIMCNQNSEKDSFKATAKARWSFSFFVTTWAKPNSCSKWYLRRYTLQ